jgi:fatty-acyl-CoA synthase
VLPAVSKDLDNSSIETERTVVALSYDYGESAEKILGSTLGAYFRNVSQRSPEHMALISCHQNLRFTYGQLQERVDEFARGMMQMGIERGDRIGIWSTNNAQWLITKLAAATIGAIFVNINPGYKASELDFVLKQSGVKLLVVIAESRGVSYLQILQELEPGLFCLNGTKHSNDQAQLQHLVVIEGAPSASERVHTFDEVCEVGRKADLKGLHSRINALDIDDPVNIQYTSGTTGAPKGATLSHHNLLNNGWLAAKAMGLTSQSRFCIPMPFYHCGGMVSSALATISVGGTIVIPGPFFVEDTVLKAISQEKCTHLSGVPTMFFAELEHPDFAQCDVSSMKGGFMAGAPCPVQLMRRVADHLNMHEVVILYGLTEASPLMTCTTIADTLEIRATTVGRAIPAIELKVIDTETGAIVPRGKQGELCTRGHGVMIGYWNNPQATAEAIDKKGWLHSGDLAVMNTEGYINITGRKKDMLIRGGENIYPREIEEVLHDHSSIAQAQVFGIPDEKFGEIVGGWIKLKAGCSLTEDELRDWLKDRIVHFKIPSCVRFVDQFPMTVTGKIQKFAMRAHMIKELGLENVESIRTA